MIEYKQFIDRLGSLAKLQRRNKVIRVLRNPWKMLYPEFLRLIHKTQKIDVKTFWSGNINAILPEYVSTFIWRYHFYEEDMCVYILSCLKKDMTFIDVGAHFGFFTLLASYVTEKDGNVLAIEPTPSTFSQLKKNASMCSNVKIYNYAVFNEERDLRFNDYGVIDSGFNSIFGLRKANSADKAGVDIIVKGRRLDDIVNESGLKNVDFVKIDAESSEIHVLEGMTGIIKEYKPKITVEVGDYEVKGAVRSIEVVEWLERYGYKPYEVMNGKIVAHNKKDIYKYSNILFVP